MHECFSRRQPLYFGMQQNALWVLSISPYRRILEDVYSMVEINELIVFTAPSRAFLMTLGFFVFHYKCMATNTARWAPLTRCQVCAEVLAVLPAIAFTPCRGPHSEKRITLREPQGSGTPSSTPELSSPHLYVTSSHFLSICSPVPLE